MSSGRSSQLRQVTIPACPDNRDRRQKGQEPLDRLDRSQVVAQQCPGLAPGLRHYHALHAHRTSRFRDGERKVIPSTTTSSGTSTPVDYVKDTPVLAPDNEHLPATFVYAGINVERCGLFTGVRGKQLAGRCTLIRTGAFPCHDEWQALIAAVEAGELGK